MRALKKWARRITIAAGVTLVVLASACLWNVSQLQSLQVQVKPIAKIPLDETAVIGRLQAALRIRTISQSLSKLSPEDPAYEFRDFLQGSFPNLFSHPFRVYTGKDFGDQAIPSVLLEWPGAEPELHGLLLMSHFDVVPIERGTGGDWLHGPFDGEVDNEFVWGRGTLDCKQGVMGILEALSLLLDEGFRPRRTIYVALGHDEEIGGRDGNKKMAEWMRQHRRRLFAVLDEGGCIYQDFPGMVQPAALVGVAEKGIVTLKLSVDVSANGAGHASMPPRETAIEVLAEAIGRIQSNPFPARIDAGVKSTLAYLAPEIPSFFNRLAMSNQWLFEPLIRKQLSSKPSGDALLRTTVATTMIQGGSEPNVLPQRAEATLNLRLLPGDSIDDAVDFLRQIVSDSRVQMLALPHGKQASLVSSTTSPAFEQLHRSIREVYPGTSVAPFVLVGSTDSVCYSDLCPNIFRFIPTRLTERDTQRFHGTNERIAKQDYLDIIRFFHRFIENADEAGLGDDKTDGSLS